MIRNSTWEAALAEYIESKRSEPFEYGTNDCSLFVAGAVQAMTGDDPMAELRGRYDSLTSSIRLLRELGAESVADYVDGIFPSVPPSRAHRGDIVLFDDSIGIVAGSFAWFVGDDELERIPREMWIKAWSVGRG